MSIPRPLRLIVFIAFQLAVATVGALGLYDRGPVAAMAARVSGIDRSRDALRCDAARAGEHAQHTPANVVRGPDGSVRYAVVRSAADCAATPTVREEVWRLAWLVLLVSGALGAVRDGIRVYRRRGGFEHQPPNEPLPHAKVRSAPPRRHG
ncbi:MAG: hypothetical protein JO180_08285 [Gemmatirosa sp.]|nr:hypothetical protein [Gemmatirosa sp.]